MQTQPRSRILRDYTPDAGGNARDDIVRSSRRREERGRNARAPGEATGSNNKRTVLRLVIASPSKTGPYAGNSSTAVLYSPAPAGSQNQADMGTIRREGPGITGNPQRLYVRDLPMNEDQDKVQPPGKPGGPTERNSLSGKQVARGASDRTHSTGSNRWSPHGACRRATGNTEGKIALLRSP